MFPAGKEHDARPWQGAWGDIARVAGDISLCVGARLVVMDLGLFAAADALRWRAHTVFVAGAGADGDLVATLATGEELVLPLDVYTPAELAADCVQPPLFRGLGAAAVDHVSGLEDIRQDVRAWCSEQLHRSDVIFTV